LVAIGCTHRAAEHPPATNAPAPETAHSRPAPRPHVGKGPSIYDLPVALRDSRGESIALDTDRGSTTLVSMFYGTCPAACPALIDAMGRIAARAPDTKLLLVSFDPAHDTPAHLADLAREHHLDARWTLAAADDPRALAAVLGIKYRGLANGQFLHTSAIVAVDGEGRPLARMEGLGDPSDFIASIAP
jgi:protein SCO1/2